MKPRVVFCADDLGMSAGANEGIRRAAEVGLVREASLCVTGAAVDAGAAIARAAGLGVGLHFTLTAGVALTGPLRGLTDRRGRFLSLPAALASCLARRPSRARVREELEAQLARVDALGLPLTHLDGHHHVHVFPIVRHVVLDVAAARGLRHVRVPLERGVRGARARVVVALAARFDALARRRSIPIARARFAGLAIQGRADYGRALLARLAAPPAEAFELMVHPRVDPTAPASEAELRALTDPELTARARALASPIGFAEL